MPLWMHWDGGWHPWGAGKHSTPRTPRPHRPPRGCGPVWSHAAWLDAVVTGRVFREGLDGRCCLRDFTHHSVGMKVPEMHHWSRIHFQKAIWLVCGHRWLPLHRRSSLHRVWAWEPLDYGLMCTWTQSVCCLRLNSLDNSFDPRSDYHLSSGLRLNSISNSPRHKFDR